VGADTEVYGILARRRAELGSDTRPFSIEPPPDSLRQRILRQELDVVGPLRLEDCLAIAAENSREYQDRREALYLAALDLTLERYGFAVQYGAGANALLVGNGEEATDFTTGADLGLSKMLGTGALIVGSIGARLFRNLASADGFDAVTDLGLSITQPLLAGSSRRIVLEPLTQAERDVIYAVRDYEIFRRDFAVDVADRLYQLLQQADQLKNEEANFQSLVNLRERNEAMAEAGRLTDVQVDQARQDELSSRNRLIVAQQRLAATLDGFKIFLGLPIETEVEIDPGELERLVEAGVEEQGVGEVDVEALALEGRLDFQTACDQRDDAERRLAVAADDLRAVLNLAGAANWSSAEGRPLDFAQEDLAWTVGLELDLPIDRFVERNRYRSALIDLRAAERAVEELGDNIRVAVRDDLRELETTIESYQIQLNAVTLAERRVESATLNLEAGRVSTRDLLEAQDDLLTAQNAATGALIDFYLARLALYRDLELLEVGDEGILIPGTIPLARAQAAP
jgi:outer membrane protein TolC